MHFSPLGQLEPGRLPEKHQLQPGDRPGLPAWGQGGDQLHRLTKSPSGLSHLACQPEEGGQVMVHKYKYNQAQIQIHRWMVTSYLPITHPTGLASSVLGLSFLALAEHFRGPERELWATCRLEPLSTCQRALSGQPCRRSRGWRCRWSAACSWAGCTTLVSTDSRVSMTDILIS